MAFFGKYLEVKPHSRLSWSNDEGGEKGQITTVTFEEKSGKTLIVMVDLYPSKEALERNSVQPDRGPVAKGDDREILAIPPES